VQVTERQTIADFAAARHDREDATKDNEVEVAVVATGTPNSVHFIST